MTGTVIVDLPIGSDCAYSFVFKDSNNQPVDLADAEFVFTMTWPGETLAFDTTADPLVLYVEEDAHIEPEGVPAYVADRLVLALTHDISRLVPAGALTAWEIEHREGSDQRNWGSGMFNGYGGMNPDA